MSDKKESDVLAEKITVRDTFEISTKSVLSFDALMVEIQKKHEEFSIRTLDIVCEWDTMEVHIGPVEGNDKRQLKVKSLSSDMWGMFVNRVRKIESQIVTYLNEGKAEDDPKTEPVFSCNVKLKIEKKDKEAQKALEDPRQLLLFAPIDLDKKRYHKDMDRILNDIKPDGKNIELVTFQKVEHGVPVGEPVELKAK